MEQQSDLDEIRKAMSSKEELEKLLKKWEPWILIKGKKWLYNDRDCEDVTQEVLLKISIKLHTFDGRSSFSSWLFPIMKHTAIDFNKKDRRDRGASVGEQGGDEGWNEDRPLWTVKPFEPDKQYDVNRRLVRARHAIAAQLKLRDRSGRNVRVWWGFINHAEGHDVMIKESLKTYVIRRCGITANEYQASRQAIERACKALTQKTGDSLYEEIYNYILEE